MNAANPKQINWSVKVGSGAPRHNSWYAQLALSPDQKTFHVGVTTGILAVTTTRTPSPTRCAVAADLDVEGGSFSEAVTRGDGGVPYPDYLRGAVLNLRHELSRTLAVQTTPEAKTAVKKAQRQVRKVKRTVRSVPFDVSKLNSGQQAALKQAGQHLSEASLDEVAGFRCR